MKISLSMIVKGGLKDLQRLKPLVEPYIDEWVVVFPPEDEAIEWAKKNGIKAIVKDFTQPIEPELRDKMAQMGIEVAEDYRIFNFAAARTESLANCTGDYVLWLDADDTPIGMDNLKKLIEKNPDADVFDAVYDYFRDEEGNPVSDHVRERLFRNNGRWQWLGGKLGLIHETVLPVKGFVPLRFEVPDNIFRVEHNTDHIDASSLRNHAALLYEYLKTNGEDPRTTYYLGIEYFNRRMFEMCIAVLVEYVKVGGSMDDRFDAWLKIAEAYNLTEDKQSAKNAFLEAQKEMPHRPESYLGLGEVFFEEENWGKAIEYSLTGMQKKLPKTKQAINMTRYTFRPSGYIAQAYLQLGRPDEAYNWFMRAAKSNPNHPWIKEHASLFLEAKDLDEYVKAFVKLGQISQHRYPKTLSKIAEIIPDELKDQELLMDFKWRYAKPKIWPNNSIVYFCSSAFEDWGASSLKTGTGGSEEAVINLTKRWAKMGYDVTVFNNCVKEETVDGVHWVRYERFNPRDIFNILIGWRNNPFIDRKVASKKFIDLHDVPDDNYYTDESTDGVKIMAKSQYHRSLLNLPDDRFVLIPNGIDMRQFKDAPEKTPNNLVWTSSYDRGLDTLLEMWSDIRKEAPDATIDVAYGFNVYDASPRARTPQGRAWKAKMLQLLDQEGVTHHGRLNSDEVAKLYLKADIWAYPTDFPEIDCITATKAMAAKCVPITTDYAVMKERNQGVLIEGDIHQQEVKERFKSELIALLKDEDKKREIRAKLDVSHHDWDTIAAEWAKHFNEIR